MQEEKQKTMEEKKSSPYRVFMWGALIAAVLCFGLAMERVQSKHPARADIYTIAGILAVLSAAGALSSGSAHERSRKSQENLRGSVEKLQDRMHDLPRALMEDAVKVAEKESQDRRTDQQKQAGELRRSLEEGLQAGFAPVAPALSQKIGESLNALSSSLQADREERAKNLRDMSDTIASLQSFQKELTKNWDALAQNSLSKMEAAITAISGNSSAGLKAMSSEASDRMRNSADQAQGWLEALSKAAASLQQASQGAQNMSEASSANQAGMKAVVETLNQSLTGVMDRLQSFAALAQGQQALLEKMETTVRRFEERSAELLEENALKIQESFLDALEKAETRDA